MSLAWTAAVPLAVVGLAALLTDWIDWSWWIAVALLLPAGVLPFVDPDRFDFLDSFGDAGDFGGGDGSGGAGDGGG